MNIPNETGSSISVHAGFPNPAADSRLQGIDLNKYLIQHSLGTFLMRIEGSSWQEFGIFHGDVVIVDRVLTPRKNDLIVWWKEDSFVIGHRASLSNGAECWGVVTTTIHPYRSLHEDP